MKLWQAFRSTLRFHQKLRNFLGSVMNQEEKLFLPLEIKPQIIQSLCLTITPATLSSSYNKCSKNGNIATRYLRESSWHEHRMRTCPVESPTTRSAMKVSSVSPERWDTMVPHPFDFARLWALIDSVTDPIWFTFNRRQLQAFLSTAVWILVGFVTVRSSPTICNNYKCC